MRTALVLMACAGEDPTDTATAEPVVIALADGANAACAAPGGTFSAPVNPDAAICFDWSGVTTNIDGGEFDAANTQYAYLLRSIHGPRETLWKAHTDGLLQSDINGGTSVDTATGCTDPDLEFFFAGTCEGDATALLLLEDTFGNLFWIPLDGCGGEVPNPVVLTTWTMLPLEAWIVLGETVGAPAGFPWVDWSALTETCWGDPLNPLEVSGVRMVPETDDLSADLGALWASDRQERVDANFAMTNAAPMDVARDADGEPFSGFEAGESWIIALDDSEGTMPAYVGRIAVK